MAWSWNDTRGLSRLEKKAKKSQSRVDVPGADDDQMFRWSTTHIDHEYSGSWGLGSFIKEAKDLLRLLGDLREVTWGEVRGMRINSKARAIGYITLGP